MAKSAPSARQIGFTEKRVRDLPTPELGARQVYVDAEGSGLRLRVTHTSRTWFVQYFPSMARGTIRYTLGRFPQMSVVRAREEARKALGKVAGKESPAEARRELRQEMTLGALFDRYLESRTRAGKRSVRDMRAQYERWMGTLPDAPAKKHGRKRIKPTAAVDWSARRLSDIEREHIEALHARIRDAEDSGGAFVANRVVELLRAALSFAVRNDLAKTNPAQYVALAPEQSRARFLQSSELAAFEAAVEAENQPWRDFFSLLLYVGYRRRAVASMAWADVDLDAGTWRVPGESAKNGEPITLALAGRALEILRARAAAPASKTWVFPGESAAGHISEPKAAWRRICERAELPDLHMHDLRRTLGSWMAMSGLSLPAIGRALGHKDPRSTAVYAHLQADAVRAAVDRAHEAMAAAKKREEEKREEEKRRAAAAIALRTVA